MAYKKREEGNCIRGYKGRYSIEAKCPTCECKHIVDGRKNGTHVFCPTCNHNNQFKYDISSTESRVYAPDECQY